MAVRDKLGRAWAHPLAPAPVLAALGVAVAAVALLDSAAPVAVLAWVVLALSAGYAVSGSV
jgi:hypothetical protein